jgi:osmotically-inducible protein OsmY
LRWPPQPGRPPDAWITLKTKLALLTTEGVSGTAIKVDTVFGRVTLHGKVGSAEEKTKAETVAQKIDGVKARAQLLLSRAAGKLRRIDHGERQVR